MSQNETPDGDSTSVRFSNRRLARKKALLWSLAAVGCVVAGMVIGGGVVFLHYGHRGPPPRPKSEEIRDRIMARLDKAVGLTPDEKADCQEIIARHMEEIDRIREESSAILRGRFGAMRDEVGVVIGPERREKWEAEIRKFFSPAGTGKEAEGPRRRPPPQ